MLGFWEKFLIAAFASGPQPTHIGIVLDGNRRWARKRGLATTEGYDAGIEVMMKVLERTVYCGIPYLTTFMLSIENFKRPKEDIEHLWKVGKEHFKLLSAPNGKLMKNSMKLCIIGRRSLIPDDVLKVIEECEEITKDNDKGILNICIAYTARDEITRGVDSLVQKAQGGELDVNDISDSMVSAEMEIQARGSPPLDILVRTGGVKRLSDFLTWQASADNTLLHFSPRLWPDWGSLGPYMSMLLAYQRKARAQQKRIKKGDDKHAHSMVRR